MPGSSLPTPAFVQRLVTFCEQRHAPTPENRVHVFGSVAPDEEADDLRALSFRRARVACALLRSDMGKLVEVAKEESWDQLEAQILLRALLFIPGPFDGEHKEKTKAAFRDYLDAVKRGWLDTCVPVSHSDPNSIGLSGIRAILAGFISDYGIECCPTALLSPKPSGCGDLNPGLGSTSAEQRAVNIGVYEDKEAAPLVREIVCRGERGKCEEKNGENGLNCAFADFYHSEIVTFKAAQMVWDCRWLRLDDNRIYISALCAAPDDAAATVEIGIAQHLTKPTGAILESSEENKLVLDTVDATVLGGAIHIMWEPPEDLADFDPFDICHWKRKFEERDLVDEEEPRHKEWCPGHDAFWNCALEETEAGLPILYARATIEGKVYLLGPPGHDPHRVIVDGSKATKQLSLGLDESVYLLDPKLPEKQSNEASVDALGLVAITGHEHALWEPHAEA